MKKKTRIIVLALALLIVLFAGISYLIGVMVFANSTQLVKNETTTGVVDSYWEKNHMDYEAFTNRYTIESIEIKSTLDGHMIPADYIYAEKSANNKNNRTVIFVHGLGGNRYSNYPVSQVFLEQGYNVITYDQRSSNENTAAYTTFGCLEKYDLIDYINYVKEKAPEQIIGVWGTSFGGATAALGVAHEDVENEVDFLILDCPVSSMRWFIQDEMKKMNLGLFSPYMVWCGNIVNKLKLGFTYEDAEVAEAVEKLTLPTLVINSKADVVTPYFMGKEIYDSIQGEHKILWTSSDSAHTDMWLDYNEEYREKVYEVLNMVR